MTCLASFNVVHPLQKNVVHKEKGAQSDPGITHRDLVRANM